MIREHLTILDGNTELVRLWGNGAKSTGNENSIFSELTGWRAQSIQLETVPKLFGEGSYVTERSRPARQISLTVWVKQEGRLALHTRLLQALRQFKTLTFRLVSTDADSEELPIILTSVGEPMRYGDGTTTFTVEGTAVDPDTEEVDDLGQFSVFGQNTTARVGEVKTVSYTVTDASGTAVRSSLSEIGGFDDLLGLEPVEGSHAFRVTPQEVGSYIVEVSYLREDDLRTETAQIQITVEPAVDPLDAPTVEFVEQEPNFTAVFSFTGVQDADSYEAQANINSTGWFPVDGVTGPGEFRVQAGPSTTVEARVRAVRGSEVSAWATAQTVLISPPSESTFSTLEQRGSQVAVEFTAAQGADSYDLGYRFSTQPGEDEWIPVTDSAQPATEYLITIPTGKTFIEVRIIAENVGGSRANWQQLTLTIP